MKARAAGNTGERLWPEFGPDTRFNLTPGRSTSTPFRFEQENRFEALKRELLSERLAAVWETEKNTSLRRAANDAASLAWTTPYPLLTFPVLFEEKAGAYVEMVEKQSEILKRSRELLLAV